MLPTGYLLPVLLLSEKRFVRFALSVTGQFSIQFSSDECTRSYSFAFVCLKLLFRLRTVQFQFASVIKSKCFIASDKK